MAQAVNRQFQVSHATSFMRYREFYSRISTGLVTGRAPRILVFGCSSGEELRTVNHYWPEAQVCGCDIDEAILDTARARAPFADVFFSDEAAIRDRGPFDLVAANSVLCRHPFPQGDYAGQLPFSMFEHYVEFLVSVLAPGGCLFLYNTNYFVDDLDIHADLTPIAVAEAWSGAFVPRVDPTGAMVARPNVLDQVLHRYVLTDDLDPWTRMRTALFRKGAGPLLSLGDRVALPPQTLMPDAHLLPQPTHARAFEPAHLDVTTSAGTLRTVFVHNPLSSAWELHGTHLLDPADAHGG